MIIRKLRPEELRSADRLDSCAFIMPVPEAQKETPKQPEYRVDRWGLFDDAQTMACTLYNHNMPIYFDGGIAAARGVGGVASDPVSRGQGHIRALFQQVLQDDYRAGVLFSTLYPFSSSFYRKFGYEVCYEGVKARIATRELKRFQTGDPPQARLLRPGDGTAALRPLYAAMAQAYNVMAARDENGWLRHPVGDPDKAERYCYVLSRDGQDVAYADFSFRQGEPQYVHTLCLTDCGYADVAGFNDMMGFLSRFASVAQTVEMTLPEDLPLASLLPEASQVEYLHVSNPMARAVCVERVLKAMRHPQADGCYTLRIDDAFLKENNGGYAVRYTKDGVVTVSQTQGDADMRLSVQTFTQLALGSIALRDALFKPDVSLRANRETLESVFVRKAKLLLDWY